MKVSLTEEEIRMALLDYLDRRNLTPRGSGRAELHWHTIWTWLGKEISVTINVGNVPCKPN